MRLDESLFEDKDEELSTDKVNSLLMDLFNKLGIDPKYASTFSGYNTIISYILFMAHSFLGESVEEFKNIKKLEELLRNGKLDEDGNMPKYHMVYTVDGVKSEQDISAVNVQKAEELIRKQYSGQSINFTSKQEIKDINEGIWDDIKSSANKRIAKHYADKAVSAYDKGNKEKGNKYLDKSVKSWDKTKEAQDTITKAKAVGDEFAKDSQEARNRMKQLRDQQQESLNEDLAYLIQRLHDEDGYLWNLHNTDYEWLYDECSKYSDCFGSADCKDSIADCIRRMPKDAQYKLLDRLVAPLHESLNEDVEDPIVVKEDAVEESEKVPQTSEEVGLSNSIIQEINGEWETIQHYNDLISMMRIEGYDSMIDVISDIVAEENTHIGQLQKCLQMISPNVDKIDDGETEASEQLGEKECINCMDTSIVFDGDFIPDDDFGVDSGFEAYL